MARMGVVYRYAAYNSFAEVGGVPKSPRSKVRMRSLECLHVSPEK